jgi:predicted lipoprotein with Yx(FWY)xxD motif
MAPSDILLKTAKAYLNALSTVHGNGIAAVTADSFYITMAPHSTGFSGQDGVSVVRNSLVQRYHGLKAVLSSMNVKIEKEWPPNEASNQVTIWTTADADFQPQIVGDDSKDDWVFKPETLFVFTMDESGEKIKHLFEFQDSVGVQSMSAVFGKAMERLGSAIPGNDQ